MSTNSNSVSLSTYKVKCGNCGWTGTMADTVGVYTQHPYHPEIVTLDISCPNCHSDNLLEV